MNNLKISVNELTVQHLKIGLKMILNIRSNYEYQPEILYIYINMCNIRFMFIF